MFLTAVLAFTVTSVPAGCVAVYPPIGRGLKGGDRERNLTFQARIADRFPVGSSESALLAELRREHFRIAPFDPLHRMKADQFQLSAERSTSDIVGCDVDWVVYWSARNGVITMIMGNYLHGEFGNTCL